MGALTILEDIRIATPCRASWDEMSGDDRVRSCPACSRAVSGPARTGASRPPRGPASPGTTGSTGPPSPLAFVRPRPPRQTFPQRSPWAVLLIDRASLFPPGHAGRAVDLVVEQRRRPGARAAGGIPDGYVAGAGEGRGMVLLRAGGHPALDGAPGSPDGGPPGRSARTACGASWPRSRPTDLSDSAIVLGKLCSRLAPILALLPAPCRWSRWRRSWAASTAGRSSASSPSRRRSRCSTARWRCRSRSRSSRRTRSSWPCWRSQPAGC